MNRQALKASNLNSYLMELLEEVDKIHLIMRELNLPFNENPRLKTVNKLKALSKDEIENLIKQVRGTEAIYSMARNIDTKNGDHFEYQMFCKAAEALGFEDVSFLKNYISTTDCIEIYNDEAVQLYRALCFFRTSSYAIEDLLVNPWFELWIRPSFVNTDLMDRMTQILQGRGGRIQTDVPTHILKEIFFDNNSILREREFIVKNKAVGPLRGKDSSAPVKGFYVITECTVVNDTIKTVT